MAGEQSPISGTQAIFEKNSIEQPQTVTIALVDKPAELPANYKPIGAAVSFTSNASSEFAKPVLLKLPYSPTNLSNLDSVVSEIEVLYWNENLEKWEQKETLGIEQENHLAKLETSHFSTYLTAIEDPGESPTGEEGKILSGESFVGEPEFTWTHNTATGEWKKEMADPGGGPEYMTVRPDDNDLQAVVGPFVTLGSSHPATISTPDFDSATFNASNIYPKIAESGNATNWDWSCDFVSEHTYLQNYEAKEERIQEPGGDAIFCQTKVLNSNLVKLNWSINASKEITKGHMLAIEFMATYAE